MSGKHGTVSGNGQRTTTDSTVAVAAALPLLHQAVSMLSADASNDEPAASLVDGRYEGGNQHVFAELRIDTAGSGVISADFFRVGQTGRTWACSVRTAPGHTVVDTDKTWAIIGTETPGGRSAVGRLSIQTHAGATTSVSATLQLDSALGGLPVQTEIPFTAERVSDAMRTVGLEIEREDGVDELPSFAFNGAAITVEAAFRNAGIETVPAGQASLIPNPASNKWGTAELHALMTDFAEAPLNRAAWQLQLLLLDQAARNGLLGVMFDSTAQLPRQGSAVFMGEIDQFTSGTHTQRKAIQTTLHELGHALNLAHRFERSVGHRDSFSIMNYDWRFGGGNRRDEFWDGFSFTFDPDELEFLRHGPRPHIIPGGAAFHSIDYWSDGNGNYSPYVPESPLDFLSLKLSPPTVGPVFQFGQPVLLEAELTNNATNSLDLSPSWLDPKTGFLDIQIQRQGSDEPVDFHPVMERCMDFEDVAADVVPAGDSIRNNFNLTFGSGGFPFIEPGNYDVTAILALPRVVQGEHVEDLVVRSAPLRIRVTHPASIEEESDALTLFRDDVGLFFALGGSEVLNKAYSDLKELCERRQGGAKRITDPVVAAATRCFGIDAGRAYVRFENGKFRKDDGDRGKAADILGQLTSKVLEFFDRHTAEGTQSLCKKHSKAAKK